MGPEEIDIIWRAQRRLCTLREGLRDDVKTRLGEEVYVEHFHPDYRFASYGHFPGTTQRLNAWLKRLASLINERKVPEDVVARTIGFFVAPSFSPEELLRLKPTVPWAELLEEEKLAPLIDATSN